MLNQVLKYLNRWFYRLSNGLPEYSFSKDCTFTTANKIEADFASTFLVGEYVKIEGSRLNDGVYKISAIDAISLTIDATVDLTITTEPEITCTLTKLDIPKELIALIAEIKTYNTNVTDGVASESQGSRSISYGTQSGWQGAFKSRLSQYRKVRW